MATIWVRMKFLRSIPLLVGRLFVFVIVIFIALHLRFTDFIPYPKRITFRGDTYEFTRCILKYSRFASKGYVSEAPGEWSLNYMSGFVVLNKFEKMRVLQLPEGKFEVSDAYYRDHVDGDKFRKFDKRDWLTVWLCGKRWLTSRGADSYVN